MPPFNPNSPAARREYYGVGAPTPAASGPAGRPRGMTVGQWAKQQAKAIIDAKVKAIEEAKRLYMQEINEDADRQRSRYDAMGAQLQGMGFGNLLRGAYRGAAADMMGLSGAMAGGMAGAIDESARLNQNMVSGTGQEGSLAGQGGILGDVVGYTEGQIPASTMGAHGEALGKDADLQPGLRMQIGYGDIETTRREAMKGLKDFMLQIAETRAGQPELRLELAKERKAEIAAQKEARLNEYMKKAALAEAIGDKRRAEYWKRKAYELDVRTQTRLENKNKGLDEKGNPLPGYRRNPKTGRIEEIPDKGSGKSGGLTPTMVREFVQEQQSQETADGMLKTIQEWWGPGANTTPEFRAKLAQRLMKQYAHLAPTKPLRKRLRAIIAKAMNDYARTGGKGGDGGGGDDFWSDS